MLREAIRFLAGAAWNGFGCYVSCPLAAGRHRWAALAARGLVGRLHWWGGRSLSAGVEGQVGNGAVLRIGAWPEEPEQPPSASAGGRRLSQLRRSAQASREAGRP